MKTDKKIEVLQRILQILKYHKIDMTVEGCGCCDSPSVTFRYKDEIIANDEGHFSFTTELLDHEYEPNNFGYCQNDRCFKGKEFHKESFEPFIEAKFHETSDLIDEFFKEHKGIDAGTHQVVLLDFLNYLIKKALQPDL